MCTQAMRLSFQTSLVLYGTYSTREVGLQEAVSWIIIKLIYCLDQFLYPASVIGHLTGEIVILCTIGMDFSTINNGNSIWTARFVSAVENIW